MTDIGKQICILEYFFQNTKITKNTLELLLIKATSRNYWLKGKLFVRGAGSKTAKEKKNNRNLIKRFIKAIYFLAKKKWDVKNHFEETIEYVANFGVDDFFHHINNAPKNSTYISTFSAEQFLKAVGGFLSDQIVTELIAAGDFTILAD